MSHVPRAAGDGFIVFVVSFQEPKEIQFSIMQERKKQGNLTLQKLRSSNLFSLLFEKNDTTINKLSEQSPNIFLLIISVHEKKRV